MSFRRRKNPLRIHDRPVITPTPRRPARRSKTGRRLAFRRPSLRSASSVERYCSAHPDAPLVLALAGTDLYGSLQTHPEAQRAVNLATRLIVLQPLGLDELPEAAQG
jgi:hypothetical protein